MSTAFPIGSNADGTVLWSDGSSRGEQSTDSGYASTSNIPNTTSSTEGTQNFQVPTDSGDSGGDSGGSSGGDSGGYTGGGEQNVDYFVNAFGERQAITAPSIDYDAVFAPAFAALDQQITASNAFTDSETASAEAGTAQRKQGFETELDSRLSNFGQQRVEANQTTENAVSAARRQASELLQGLQSRYGGTTGTGRFRSEILGAQATRNIAQNNVALQNTMTKIGQAENDIKTQVTQLIAKEDTDLANTKLKLKSNLQQALADISSERGRLEVDKGNRRQEALQNYQAQLQAIETRNSQFRQRLFFEAQDAQTQLAQLKTQAQSQNTVDSQEFSPDGLSTTADASQNSLYTSGGQVGTDEDPYSTLLP